ncbi:MAG: DUF4982 domain-containing protein [Prevotellaceae bacterium]|nr:DUF4982 domain-containing protein [Prevotellaceae bacterium]MDO4932395.1 DUF4982 domain-containing protein [Prevotellaceae bacterium]
MKKLFPTILSLALACTVQAGERYNFNAAWKLAVGNEPRGSEVKFNDSDWQNVTLPYAFNQHEAFGKLCAELSDTVMWYRKRFTLPKSAKGKRVYVEFEGARFGAQVFINGHELGWGENGVMAFGFDLTPYIKYKGENVLAVFVDNNWKYHEHLMFPDPKTGRMTGSGFQWNDKNFYCNYGGINKNVWLHIMPQVHQTLPLYSNLGTTGVYVYAKDIDVRRGAATVCAETQVVNGGKSRQTVQHKVTVIDKDGREVASFLGDSRTVSPGDTVTLKSQKALEGLHLWSWGYGYLYTVKSSLVQNGRVTDEQSIRTGFRKTEFKDGMVYLNDRVLQLKGFAQRSTNEWPALGISIPAWMSDYSNSLILGCNGNFVRWMHVTPSRQDVLSFDRLGLIQAMPAGDAERDVTGRRWEQRCEVMRDAIIYNRNNPSILFYEGGNNNISDPHMADLKAIRDQYDPHGGRAAGSRNMLSSKEAEYGGEMLYVNKSAGKPMWQMEYNRDEGIRRYWDRWSYPYHEEGEGPLYRGARAVAYNHNQDGLAIENIIRWNEYWMARPGTGRRVNSGGAKIIFSDSNTHARGEKNYRTSGDVDPMRLPKDSWFVHRTMWDGWVDTEHHSAHIIGHWNYPDTVVKPVYVCSTADSVELFLNGRNLGPGRRSETFLFTWDSVAYNPGTLRAVAYKDGKAVAEDSRRTVGQPVSLRMRWVDAPEQFRADNADIRIAEIEAVDAQGQRHPLAHDMIEFSVSGEGEYIGGVSGVVPEEEKALNAAATPQGQEGIISEGGHSKDSNMTGSRQLMLEAGVIRVMVRSTLQPGDITLTATPTSCDGAPSTLKPAQLTATTTACPVKGGFYVNSTGQPVEADWAAQLPLYLERGATPQTPSFTQKYITVPVKSVEAAVNKDKLHYLTDDIEATDAGMYGVDSRWSSDGIIDNAWLKVTLERPAAISQIALRMAGFRTTSYPLQVFAHINGERRLVWQGFTPKNLGDAYIDIAEPVMTDQYEIRMIGPANVKEAFASMTELAARKNVSTKASKSNVLSIIEMQFSE